MSSESSPIAMLGVDIGTTATKVVAFDAGGVPRETHAVTYPLEAPHPGEATQDPDALCAGVVEATRAVATAVQARGGRIAGLAFSAAMHSLIAIDRAGRPLTASLTWADSRATEQAERLRAATGGLALHRRTGTPLHPMSPLAKLVWFREIEPATFAAARHWVGIKEYVLTRLTGELVVDHSIASASGLMGSATLDWDAEALALASIDRAALPALVPAKHSLALTTAAATALGVPPATPVVVGAGDGPLANLGVGAVRPGVAACSIGTSGAMRVMVERPAVDLLGRVFCYALIPGRWVVGGAINNGGIVLEWAADALAPDLGADAEEALLTLAAQAPPGSDGLIMLPYLLSERAPHWSALPRGAYVGLTRAHRREHLVRAALEGVCQQLALVLHSMQAAGNDVRAIRATGGFARSPLWRQMLCDAVGMPISFATGHEGSSFGAALLGLEALGLVESIDVAAELVRIEQTTRPDPAAAATYKALLPVVSALYDALVPAFTSLRRLAPGLPSEPAS